MKLSGEAKIILGSTMFALIPICVMLAPGFGIESLLFGRIFFASLIFFAIFKNKSSLFKLSSNDLRLLITWAFIMSVAMLTYFYAIRFCGAAISSALLGIQPVMIVLLAYFVLREFITKRSIYAVILTMIGILLVSNFNSITSNSNALLGECLAIISAFLLSINFIYQKKYLKHFDSQKLVFYQSVFQLPIFFPFLFKDNTPINFSYVSVSLILGIFCTVIAYTLIYKGASEVDAQKIGILQSIEYVLPVIIGYYLFNEKINLMNLLGVCLIIISCIIINFTSRNVKLV